MDIKTYHILVVGVDSETARLGFGPDVWYSFVFSGLVKNPGYLVIPRRERPRDIAAGNTNVRRE